MRLFRKKSETGNQEYLDGLINSIRQARREEQETPGLHSFADDEYFPTEEPLGPPRVPPGVPHPVSGASPVIDDADAEAVADLEAYLSALNAAEAAAPDEEDEPEDSASY
jgi:hypothetical protein